MAAEGMPRCPVCRASFRGTPECSRCGADLGPIMVLGAKSHVLRHAARSAVWAGDFARAGELSRRAEEICPTAAGRKLRILTEWLAASRRRGSASPSGF